MADDDQLNRALQDIIAAASMHDVTLTAVVSTRHHARAFVRFAGWMVIKSVCRDDNPLGDEGIDTADYRVQVRHDDPTIKERIADTIHVLGALKTQVGTLGAHMRGLADGAIEALRGMGVRITLEPNLSGRRAKTLN